MVPPKYLCVFLFYNCIATALSTTIVPLLKCRLCHNANSLDDCNKLTYCSASEACYMEELITEQLTVVYNGGCRARDVCQGGSSSAQIGKRNTLVSCSSCCDYENDCNKRLCSIKSLSLNASHCYSCDRRHSEQSEVHRPEDCVTLTTCQPNEMCYLSQQASAGRDTFFYGCYSKQVCRVLMSQTFADIKLCSGTNPDPRACGTFGKRSTSLCHSCCGDGGCNYGSCEQLNRRLFKLYDNNLLDPVTLKVKGSSTSG